MQRYTANKDDKENLQNMSENLIPETGTSEQNQPAQNSPALQKDLTENLPTPKKKKSKKKKKKGQQKQSHNTSQEATQASLSAPLGEEGEPLTMGDSEALESLPVTPEVIITLPVKPDEWFIKPETYDEEGNLLTEETFIFLKDGVDIINMPLTETNFEGLLKLLIQKFPPKHEDETQADRFHIRKPLDNEETNPVMTLTQKNRILATTEMDQKTLKRLIKALQGHVEQRSPVTTWLNNWWHKHKILRVLVCIAALPLALVLLYTVFWGMTH